MNMSNIFSSSRLNNHRDLPDHQDDLVDEEDFFEYEEGYGNGELYSEKQNVVGSKDEPTSQRN